MNIHWHLEKSRSAVVIALILALHPMLLSLLLPLSTTIQSILIIQTPIAFWLMHNELAAHSGEQNNRLSWKDGQWSLGNEKIIRQGYQTNKSFSLGLLIHLSIKGDYGKSIGFWLFPDSVKNNHQDWRLLHACIHLSRQINPGK